MTRRTIFVLNTVLITTGFAIGCGGDDPTDPSPLPCSYTLSPTSHSIGSDGGAGSVTVTTRSDCQWSAAPSAGWITIVAGTSGTGNGSVGYTVAANPSETARTGTITVAGLTLAITQSGRAACTFDISPQQQSFAAAGGNGTLHVAAPPACSWTATTTAPWLTISSGSSGQGDGDVSYVVADNKATEPRGGTIDIAGRQVAVSQAAAEVPPGPIPTDCQYSVAPVELRMHWHQTGGDVALTTAAGCRWTVDSDTPWLTVASDSQGAGSGTIRFSMSTLTEENSRAAALRVRWPTPTAGQNVWVTQEGCSYAVSVTTANFTADGGSGIVNVYGTPMSANCMVGCPWTATSQVPWIRIVSGSPGVGDDRFTYQLDPNPGSQERVGQILVQHRIITIRQAGR
jgi:BACON domain-containing protein/all-beta uncharacterized protein